MDYNRQHVVDIVRSIKITKVLFIKAFRLKKIEIGKHIGWIKRK